MVFCKLHDWEPIVIPANEIITNVKEIGLTTFIGTDSHPATAELRPSASHNVRRHLYDLAVGISETVRYLESRTRHKGTVLMALPWVAPEALGGHIHTSFWVDDPLVKEALQANLVYHSGKLRAWHTNGPMMMHDPNKLQEYIISAVNGTTVTPENVCRTLDFLLMPFECWIQPWGPREKRMQWCLGPHHYNAQNPGNGDNANYLVRWLFTTPPARQDRDGLSYMHVEYRTPSTWLIHPWLAYVYFSLAKLTMLNYNTVNALVLKHPPKKPTGENLNHLYKEMFERHIGLLMSAKPRRTPDLSDLERAVVLCDKSRTEWFGSATAGVDYKAWRTLIS